MSKRVHYIDWLRVLAVLLLFPFHVSRVSNAYEAFYVKSAHLSAAIDPVLSFISVWHMPLLFMLAGASSYFALKKRTGGQYALERLGRIMLPFAVGFVLLIPPQTWYGAQFNSGYTGSFLHYIVSGDFLVWNIRDGGDYFGGFGIGHLWFLLWLFVISIAALPLMMWGKREGGSRQLSRFARLLASPAGWLVAALAIFIGEAMPDPVGKNVFFYFVFFALGYCSMFNDSFAESAERMRWLALALGVGLSLTWVFGGSLRDSLPDPSWGRVAFSYGGALASWTSIVAAIGFGKHYLDTPSKALAYLAPASYPLYLLHQTVIVVAAFYIVQLPVGGVVQWLALFTATIAGTFGGYELLRRLPVKRFFGIS
ncbi:MAG TPA: acyltransferase family protein [Coriobacteriia bacterium]|nr:acyltransferase family protein [Coriobacteriia bacterium]